MSQLHLILIVLTFFPCFKVDNQTKNFKKGNSLEMYYPLKNISSVEMENWKGNHLLTKTQIEAFYKDLKTYSYAGNFAHTKPGHLSCKVIFKNNSYLFFYSNASSEIIISTGPINDHTFVSKSKINFENY